MDLCVQYFNILILYSSIIIRTIESFIGELLIYFKSV